MKLASLLKLGSLELAVQVGKLSEAQKQALESEATALASRAGEISAYLGHRGAFGLGDKGHDRATLAGRTMLTKVRRALGYTYP